MNDTSQQYKQGLNQQSSSASNASQQPANTLTQNISNLINGLFQIPNALTLALPDIAITLVGEIAKALSPEAEEIKNSLKQMLKAYNDLQAEMVREMVKG
jgi:hypothetical protein